MGLDVYPDVYSGGYPTFNIWRNILTELAGYWVVWAPRWEGEEKDATMDSRLYEHYPLVFIDWGHITPDNLMGEWEKMPEDPLMVLIAHHDTDGIIHLDHAGPLADRLEELFPLITNEIEDKYKRSIRQITKDFIEGLRLAVSTGETVTFG